MPMRAPSILNAHCRISTICWQMMDGIGGNNIPRRSLVRRATSTASPTTSHWDGREYEVPIDLTFATITADPSSSSNADYNDPTAPARNATWLLPDNTAGNLQFDLGQIFQPTRMDLNNTAVDGRGTKSWSFHVVPSGGIANLTYVDPSSGKQSFCDARCPLPQNNATFQRFFFVNLIQMNSFRIEFMEWYGQGAGLDGIVLKHFAALNTMPAASTSFSASTPTGNVITTTSAPAEPTNGSESGSSGLTAGAKAGVGTGVAIGALLIAGFILFYLRRKKSRDTRKGGAEGYVKPELEDNPTLRGELPAEQKEIHELPVNERPLEAPGSD